MGDIPKYLPRWGDGIDVWHFWKLVTSPFRTFPENEAGLGWFARVENVILLLTTLKPGCYRVQVSLCALPLEDNCVLCITVHQQTPLIITNLTLVINVLTGDILYVITHWVGQKNSSSEQWEKLISLFTHWKEWVERKFSREEYLVSCSEVTLKITHGINIKSHFNCLFWQLYIPK